MKNRPFPFALTEVIPLPIFLIYTGIIDPTVSSDWLGPYIASSIAAVISTTALLVNNIPLNRLFIGVNLYLISGSIGLIAEQDWLNQLYGNMQAAGMLAWIVAVAAISTLFSPLGFIGVESADKKAITVFSLSLLFITLLAFLFSLYFLGNKIFSEYIPFITLFLAQRFLRSKLTKERARNKGHI